MRLRYCDGKNKYFPPHENKRRRKNKFLIKRLNKHLILSQGWIIKRTVQNEPFVTKFPFILTNLGIWKSCRRKTHLGIGDGFHDSIYGAVQRLCRRQIGSALSFFAEGGGY